MSAPDRDELLEALRNLANSAGGLAYRGKEIRALIGNSKWTLLMQRVADADAIIIRAGDV